MHNSFHIPGLPKTPQPAQLVEFASSLYHPDVIKSGITTTKEGEWALLVTVKKNTPVPIKKVEKNCIGFPVIYQEDSGRMLVARPAYPALGE